MRLRPVTSAVATAAATALLLASVVGPAQTPASASGPCGTATRAPAGYDHVVWVVLENRSYEDLVGRAGSTAARRSPYLRSLVRACGLATRYYAVGHPSLPNYLAMVSGGTGGVTTDCIPARCPQDRPSSFALLRSHGHDWRVYAESMTRRCQRSSTDRYVARHNPPTYFRDAAVDCRSADVPMGSLRRGRLVRDLAGNRLADFTIVVPNQCHNTHDCPIATGDAWLSRLVPRIVRSPAYRAGRTALVVTWDEGSGGPAGQDCVARRDRSCHVATVLVAPSVRPGTRSATVVGPYSLLRTTQELLGIGPPLGHAGDPGTRSMRAAFRL